MVQQIAIGVLRFFAWLYLAGATLVSVLLLLGVFVNKGLMFLPIQSSNAGIAALLAAMPAIFIILGGGFVWALLLVIASLAEDIMIIRHNPTHPTHFTR